MENEEKVWKHDSQATYDPHQQVLTVTYRTVPSTQRPPVGLMSHIAEKAGLMPISTPITMVTEITLPIKFVRSLGNLDSSGRVISEMLPSSSDKQLFLRDLLSK